MALTLAWHAHAHATRPMVVDDASITAPGHCQVQSWTQRTQSQTEFWAVPACNVAGTWELAAGVGRIAPDGGGPGNWSGVLQAKTVFRPLEKNGWGVGLTLANQLRAGSGLGGDLSVLVPVSASLLDDRILLHVNAGWVRALTGRRHDGVWAAGTEWAAQPGLTLTVEAYGALHGHGFVQAGLRWQAIPDRLAFDIGIGDRARQWGAERYYTIGLTLAGRAPR